MFRKTFLIERILLLLAGICLMDTTLIVNVIALAVVGGIVASQLLIKAKVVSELKEPQHKESEDMVENEINEKVTN